MDIKSMGDMVQKAIVEAVVETNDKTKKELGDKIRKQVLEDLKLVRPLSIKIGKKVVQSEASLLHEKTDVVLSYVASRIPLLLVGPAGCGKTQIAVQCAKMLDLNYYSISVNEQTSKSDFMGYKDANGKIVETNFRKAYEKGGVFIIDEIDAGNPNILTVINSALSNDFCPFPDKMVERHEDFICICTANTFGEGESMQYIGRNILDAATKDRFTTVFIGYSPLLEKALVPRYHSLITKLREYFAKNNAQIVVSTRSGIRLETIRSTTGKISYEQIIDCLNLHTEIAKDTKLADLIKGFIKENETAEKTEIVAEVVTEVDRGVPKPGEAF